MERLEINNTAMVGLQIIKNLNEFKENHLNNLTNPDTEYTTSVLLPEGINESAVDELRVMILGQLPAILGPAKWRVVPVEDPTNAKRKALKIFKGVDTKA